jgi:hypothetical protein
MAVKRDDVGVVDITVRAGLTVAGKRLLQCFGGGCGAQPGVAVDMVGTDRSMRDHAQRVVLLQKQLPSGVETQRTRALLIEQLLAAPHDPVHRDVPVGLHQPAALPNHGPRQAVRGGIGLPTEQVLGAKTTVSDPVHLAPRNPDDATAGHRDVHRISVGMQDGGGLDPSVDLLDVHTVSQVSVNPHRPALTTPVRGTRPPWLGNPITHDIHTSTRRHVSGLPWRTPPQSRETPVQQLGCYRSELGKIGVNINGDGGQALRAESGKSLSDLHNY